MGSKVSKTFDLYNDIKNRTNGELYLGVVGPVRTGKSTFIKRFMDLFVLPNMENENEKERAIDELPQSAQGKTIMTTEPKFIPQEAALIRIDAQSQIKVRLVDCVGYMVEGANGYLEGDETRMVKTPWAEEEIPFSQAAEIGTRKVIHDHATIGVIVTTDGSIGEIPRENYESAEESAIYELKEIGKPFVVVLNCVRPYSEETIKLKEKMEEKYHVTVIPMNCKQMRKEEMNTVLETILMEFPIEEIFFYVPKWIEMLSCENELKKALIQHCSAIQERMDRMKDVYCLLDFNMQAEQMQEVQFIKNMMIDNLGLNSGIISIRIEVEEKYYYSYISEMTGVPITSEYQMIGMIRQLAQMKEEYEKVREAVDSVRQKGYGVVMPVLEDITMEDPVLISHGNKYGVKMRAVSPSIHMIKANIETEIAPIVGNKEQAEDLITYIKEGEQNGDGVWTTNIFGKTVGELMEDGIRTKIMQMDDQCQIKLQDSMQKIVNDSNGGMICIII